MVKNDPEEALKYYLPALADTSDGNGILKRELLEVIPICLSKIGDNMQGTAFQNFTRLEKPAPDSLPRAAVLFKSYRTVGRKPRTNDQVL